MDEEFSGRIRNFENKLKGATSSEKKPRDLLRAIGLYRFIIFVLLSFDIFFMSICRDLNLFLKMSFLKPLNFQILQIFMLS